MLPPGARPSGPGADPRSSQPTHDAAKESNLPSRGLPGPAGFEDRMGHQARAAPWMMLAALVTGENPACCADSGHLRSAREPVCGGSAWASPGPHFRPVIPPAIPPGIHSRSRISPPPRRRLIQGSRRERPAVMARGVVPGVPGSSGRALPAQSLVENHVAHAGEQAVARLRVRADLLQLLQLAPGAVRRQVVVEGPLWHLGVG
jgi:hypothetical protein